MKPVIVIALAAAAATVAGICMNPGLLRRAASALSPGGFLPQTGAALSASGVHKCQGANGVLYLDHACPQGTRELAANGGTVNVMAFPKPAPAPAPASVAAAGPRLIQGMSQEEVERMRDRRIEQAADR